MQKKRIAGNGRKKSDLHEGALGFYDRAS